MNDNGRPRNIERSGLAWHIRLDGRPALAAELPAWPLPASLLVAIRHLLLGSITVYQAAVLQQDGMVTIFGCDVLMNLVLVGSIYLVCRMERNCVTELVPGRPLPECWRSIRRRFFSGKFS